MGFLKSLFYYWGGGGDGANTKGSYPDGRVKQQGKGTVVASERAKRGGGPGGGKKGGKGKQKAAATEEADAGSKEKCEQEQQRAQGGGVDEGEGRGRKGGRKEGGKGEEREEGWEGEQQGEEEGGRSGSSSPDGRAKKQSRGESLLARAAWLVGHVHRLSMQLLFFGVFLRIALATWFPSNSSHLTVSFQEFRNDWLAERRVTQLQVANEKWAYVFGEKWPEGNATGLLEGAEGPLPKPKNVLECKFTIGDLSRFEDKLEQAQRELGFTPEEFVPVKFVVEPGELQLIVGYIFSALNTLFLTISVIRLFRTLQSYFGGRDPYADNSGGGQKRGSIGGSGGLLGSLGGMLGMAQPHQLDKAVNGRVLFKDVAGCDEAKNEIIEFVDYLKHPKKYQSVGAQIPKGALLVGPPGTGKTLLARATAGEAGVPFLGMSGSEFCEMFAGIGSSKVRDLFAQARQQAPCIIFIDEIDAIGRARGKRAMGADADRESTLNQLLVEMDGFASTDNVVVLGSTNRADILDKALLRPGRFSRQISVDAPDVKGREQIFRVYLAKLKLQNKLDFYPGRLSALTPGMTGADISNVCNEAALYAARQNRERIDMPQFEAAIDRVIGGLEKKNKVISKEERRVVATHESGHAVVSWFLEFAEPLLKVSIVPRGSSTLGFAQYLPNENLLMNKEQLLDNMKGALGGRAAEQVILGKISTGAVNDLEKVTQMAYAQVAVFGMNEKVGLLSYRLDQDAFDKPYSNETAHMVDTEARLLVSTAYAKTIEMVEEKRDLIMAMAELLLEKEVIGLDDLENLLGKRPFQAQGELRNIDRYRSSVNEDSQQKEGGKKNSKRKKGGRAPAAAS